MEILSPSCIHTWHCDGSTHFLSTSSKLAPEDRSRQNVWMKVNCQFTCEYVWISATWWADSMASLHTCAGTAQRLRVLAGGRASASTGVIFPLTLHPCVLIQLLTAQCCKSTVSYNTLLYSVIKGLVYPTLRPGSHQTHANIWYVSLHLGLYSLQL